MDHHLNSLQNNCRLTTPWTWKSKEKPHKILHFSKTLIPKPFTQSFCLSRCPHPPHAIPEHHNYNDPTTHTALLVESFHEHQRLKILLQKLNKNGSCPLKLLQDYGDWSKDHFWAVVRFLTHSSRSSEILPVFDMWKEMEKYRINEFNYEKIIGLLGEEGLMEDATSAFMKMEHYGLSPSLQVYNSIIHGFARIGKFDEALLYHKQMKETNLSPESDTYDGLIVAYGKYKMYDEMGMCLKKMQMDGCTPDRFTYNLLIQEFARGGLLSRMERVYQSMRTKRMDLHSTTLIAMLEAYANFGIVEKMEKTLRRLQRSKAPLKEDLIRKIANVYIENYMFSRLDNLGDDLASKSGRTDTVWCLRLLSHACLLSHKGMDSVISEMERDNVPLNVTVVNILSLAYLKMKDFTHLRMLLSKLPHCLVKPDIVTFGILFDANDAGFYGTKILESWRRRGLLYRCVEMNTDSLVLTAFGKGKFLKNCEDIYTLEHKATQKKQWTYFNFIDLVAKRSDRKPHFLEVE